MKKFLFTLAFLLCLSQITCAADLDLKALDAASRSANPNNGSIMFRQNAAQYEQLSDEQKAQLDEDREAARKQAQEYRRQQEAYARQRAQAMAEQRAREEAERQRAEALKPITLYENKLKIYALVNGEVITSSEMQSRINAFILTTGIPYNSQTKNMIQTKVLQSVIDEKLKIQAAKKNNIRVSATEINRSIREFEKENNMPAGQLKKILSQAKVSMNTWNKQVEADLAWQKYVSQKGYSQIHIGESAINQAIEDIKKDMKTQKWMVSEIVISKKDAKDIRQLSETLRHDPRFELYAMQFSQSPSSANGGKLGWITKGKLPPVLENALLKLPQGGVTDPIAYGSDYYILKMDQIFNPEHDLNTIPSRAEIKRFLENKKLEELSTKYIKDLRNRALIEKKI